jgi:site-specific recombinase XerD
MISLLSDAQFKSTYFLKDKRSTKSIYKNYYIPLFNAIPLHDLISGNLEDVTLFSFIDSMSKLKRSTSILYDLFDKIGIHSSLKTLISNRYVEDEYKQELYKKFCIISKSNGYRTTYQAFISALDLIPYNTINSLSKEQAINFCISAKAKYVFTQYKIDMLLILEYVHINLVIKLKEERDERLKVYDSIKTMIKSRIDYEDFINLETKIKIEDIPTCTSTKLSEIINNGKDGFVFYKIIRYILDSKNKTFLMKTMENTVNPKYMHVTIADLFCGKSEWRITLLNSIMQTHKIRLEHTSSQLKQTYDSNRYITASILNFISSYSDKIFHVSPEIDSLKYFLDTCTYEDVVNSCIEYCSSKHAHNDLIKNQLDMHHAKRHSQDITMLFKRHLQKYIKPNISGLKTTNIIQNVDNERVVGEFKRRTYTDDEIDKMFEQIKDDPEKTLLLTILREIGLRRGALKNIQYKHIADLSTPKHSCRMIEKGNKYRNFITSPNLKRVIATYIHYIKNLIQDHTDEYYLFGSPQTKYQTPISKGTISGWLKRIASYAGITDVIVHPHSFRHTLVGKLMDAGNSIDTVSKFIGHSDPEVTSKYYHIRSIEELSKDIKNPFHNIYKSKDEEREEERTEIEELQSRIDGALVILHTYDSIISECIEKGETASTVRDKVIDKMPNIKNLMRLIADSMADTNSVRSSLSTYSSIPSKNPRSFSPIIEEETVLDFI